MRINGVEHEVGEVFFPAGAVEHGSGRELKPPSGAAAFDFGGVERVDVILRPDPDAAEETVGMTEFWNGEMTLRGVPILREPGRDEP